MADSGTITTDGGAISVRDVQTPLPGLDSSTRTVTWGEVLVNMPAFS